MKDQIRIKSPFVEERLCNALMKSIETRLAGMDLALELKTKQMDYRLQGLNELREEVVQDRSQLVKAETFNTKHEMVLLMIGELKESIIKYEAAQGKLKNVIATWIVAVGFMLGVLDFILRMVVK